jgi:hypothetical protein
LIDALRIVPWRRERPAAAGTGFGRIQVTRRRLGYRERDRGKAALALSKDIQEWMNKVHAIFVARFE